MTTIEILITLAKTMGYAVSVWKKHQGIKCPECGKDVIVFYHILRQKPRVAACVCGYRKIEGRKAVNINRDGITTKASRPDKPAPVVNAKRCKGITKKGEQCKRVATHGDYCSLHTKK